jgi:glutathione S-transferase
VYIALIELGLPFKQIHIDLTAPRPAWYLQLNPRGQVPTLVYNGTVLVESALIVQFLADAHPSRLACPSGELDGPKQRYLRRLLVERFEADCWPVFQRLLSVGEKSEKEKGVEEFVTAVERELEPSMKDAQPFFGGAESLTVVEVRSRPSTT